MDESASADAILTLCVGIVNLDEAYEEAIMHRMDTGKFLDVAMHQKANELFAARRRAERELWRLVKAYRDK